MDHDNKDALFRLLRFQANFTSSPNELTSFEEYLTKMKPGQKKIYFVFGSNYEAAMNSPFYEPFKKLEVPVLVLTNQLDEFCLTSSQEYKGTRFENLEQAEIEQIRKDLGIEAPAEDKNGGLPEEDVTNFCLWLKDIASEKVS